MALGFGGNSTGRDTSAGQGLVDHMGKASEAYGKMISEEVTRSAAKRRSPCAPCVINESKA